MFFFCELNVVDPNENTLSIRNSQQKKSCKRGRFLFRIIVIHMKNSMPFFEYFFTITFTFNFTFRIVFYFLKLFYVYFGNLLLIEFVICYFSYNYYYFMKPSFDSNYLIMLGSLCLTFIEAIDIIGLFLH